MHMRNAIKFHILLISLQPLYYLIRFSTNTSFFSTASLTWLLTSSLIWLFILTRITIPVLTTPLAYLPSPSGDRFPFGHRWVYRGGKQPPTGYMKAIAETENDGVIAFWDPFYLRPRTVVTNVDSIMEVLNTRSYDWQKPGPAKMLLSRVLGQGLIIVEGNVHKMMRKSVAPAFSGRQTRDLVPLFWSKGVDFAQSLAREAAKAGDEGVEMMAQMSRVTLDIIGSAGVGLDFNTINNNENRLARLYEEITSTKRGNIIVFVLINVLIPPWIVRNLYGTLYARVANANKELRTHIREMVAQKKQNLKVNSTAQRDIIATIIKSGDFSDDYLCDQLLTFLAAGHDTTASALTWTVWLLATHPNIQDRLRTELAHHLSTIPTEEMTAVNIDTLPYLTAVCNETLRLYPTVPITARRAAVDTKIGIHHIPRGTETVVIPWQINRSKELWGPDAEEYNPDRWLEGGHAASGGATNPYAFMTFLYGPRSCIGQGFAKMEMKCILAAIVMRFRLEMPDWEQDVQVGGFLTIKPLNGLKLRLIDLKTGN